MGRMASLIGVSTNGPTIIWRNSGKLKVTRRQELYSIYPGYLNLRELFVKPCEDWEKRLNLLIKGYNIRSLM
jgi:hypothetical protein